MVVAADMRKTDGLRRLVGLFLGFLLLSGLTGCSEEPATQAETTAGAGTPVAAVISEPEFASLLALEAQALLAKEPNTLIVDVRTEAEREQVRIPGSVAVPLADVLKGVAGLPKDKPLLLVCAVGGRSYAAGLYLAQEKYPRIYNLRGGISAWQKAGLPLEYGKK